MTCLLVQGWHAQICACSWPNKWPKVQLKIWGVSTWNLVQRPPLAHHQDHKTDSVLLACYQAELVSWHFSWEQFLAGFGSCAGASSFFGCGRCVPLHAGNVTSSDWKLHIGFQPEVARAKMSRTGWSDVVTANAARCIPNNGHVRNSLTGVFSIFMRRFCICSTEQRIKNFTFLQNVNAGGNPTSVCMIIAEVNDKPFFNFRLFSICKSKFTCKRLFGEPDLITLWMLSARFNKPIYGKAGSHCSGTTWVKNQESHKSDENKDLHIHKGVPWS